MLAFIEGTVIDKDNRGLVVANAGLGYAISTPISTLKEATVGQTVQLWLYEHIREDCHELYGFTDQATRQIFELLMTTSGIGSKMALNLLNIGQLSALKSAIVAGNSHYLSQAVGVGQKLADRLSLELKDKIKRLDGVQAGLQATATPAGDETLAALKALGLSPTQAKEALEGVDVSLPTSERLRAALKNIKT